MQAEATASGDDDVTIVRTITVPDEVVGRAAARGVGASCDDSPSSKLLKTN